MNLRFLILYVGSFLYTCSSLCGSSFTYALSDFTSGLDGWGGGADGEISTEGAINAGNDYMRKEIDLDGAGGTKARMVVRRPVNSVSLASDSWLGDFISKGIQSVQLDFRVWSSDPIYLRLALSDVTNPMISTGTWWVSKTYFKFNQQDGWGTASFNLIENEMQRVGDFNGGFGTDSLQTTLSNVNGFRFIGSSSGNSALGDQFSGVIGMDNIKLISIPEPSATAAVLVVLASVSVFLRRRI